MPAAVGCSRDWSRTVSYKKTVIFISYGDFVNLITMVSHFYHVSGKESSYGRYSYFSHFITENISPPQYVYARGLAVGTDIEVRGVNSHTL